MKVSAVTSRLIAPALALVVLGGIVTQRLSRDTPADAEAYHQQVRKAIEDIPYRIGDWTGTNIDVPPEAVKLLHPNSILSRRYVNSKTNQSISLLLVHCRDARDMTGHYPPVCYPANGWVQRRSMAVSWQVNPRLTVPVAEYEFVMWLPSSLRTMWVANTLVLPDGTMTRDMSEIKAAGWGNQARFFGAGQIQVVFGEYMRESEREKIFKTFLNAIEPVLQVMESGVQK